MPMKYALTMLVYAICLLVSGYVTMSVAPPGSSPKTAMIIPAIAATLVVAAGVLSLMIKSNRKLGMIGIHVGLVLPLIIGAGSLLRVTGSMGKASEFNSQLSQIQAAVSVPGEAVQLTRVSGDGSERDRDARMQASWISGDTPTTISTQTPWRPFGYQAVGMISIAMLSLLAFVSLLLHRPAVPQREAGDDLLDID